MAKNEKLTLTLDFNVERGKLQEISNILGKDTEKGLRGSKSIEYFNSLKETVIDVTKVAENLYKGLSKPLITKAQAKELSSNFESAFKGVDNKLLSLQGNLSKTYGSANNMEALKQIRELGKEIDKLSADYQKISQLWGQTKNLGNKSELKSQLSSATKQLDALSKKEGELTSQEIAKQDILKKTIDDINAKLEEKARIQQQISDIQTQNGVSSQNELSGLIGEKINEQQGLINGSVSIQDANTLKDILSQIRDIIKDIVNTSNAMPPIVNEEVELREEQLRIEEEQAKTFKSVLRDLGIPLLTLREVATQVRKIISYSYDYIKNLDAALTEISIVSGKSRQEVLELTDTFIELSAKTGMAIDDIAKASTIFYQQGLNDEAVKKMTEYTAIFAKISSETVEVASNQITAAINGFNLSVDQAGDVIDKLSVLAAYSAADIDELATAMSKAASQANMAGLSFDQYNAYLATMIEVTREAPENIGTSLKTIMSRFQSIKTGDNTEDDTDVNAVEKALKSVGVQLRDSEGQLRDLGEVLEELGPKWNGLSRNTQAYLGTIIAGTRQQSRFISLMQNWDRALELTTASQNSAGAATRMHQSAMEGLDAALNNLTNAWQKLISNIANGDSFKWLINALTSVVKWFADGHSLLKIFTTAMLLFNAKTLMVNSSLAAQSTSYKNLNNVVRDLRGQITKLINNNKALFDSNSRITQQVNLEAKEVENLANKYRDLANAKNGVTATQTPNPITPGATGGTGVGGWTSMVPQIDTKGVDQAAKSVGGLNTKLTALKGKAVTAGKNITGLIGTVQTAITAGLLFTSLLTTLEDWFTTTADEIKEKAQAAYDKTQKEIDARTTLIDSVEANLNIYEKLAKKVNKTTEEMEEMAKAADELAQNVPKALVGYDVNGNPIINTNEARAAQKNAKEELAEYAKEQMGNIGNLSRASMRKMAEETVGNKYNAAQTGGLIVAGTGAAGIGAALVAGGTAADATVVGLPVGIVMQVAGGLMLLGTALFAGASIAKESNIKAEQLSLSVEKANKIQEEYGDTLLKNLSYITANKITTSNINGTTGQQRSEAAAYIGNEWLDNKVNDLIIKHASGEISDKEFEKKFKELGTEWEKFLDKIGEKGLANFTKIKDEIATGVGDKTYKSVEDAVKKAIKNDMGIKDTDPMFEAVKEAFMNAIYGGYGKGINAIVKDLENRKLTALEGKEEGSEEYKKIEKEYDKVINNVKSKMTNNQVSFYDAIGLTEDIALFSKIIDEYAEGINNALKQSNEAAAIQSIAYLETIKREAQEHMATIGDIQSEEYKKWESMAESAAKSIEDAWNTMDISIDIPWKDLWEDFEKYATRMRTTWQTVYSELQGDGLSLDQWKSFTTLLDDINFEAFDDSQLLQYANALDTVAGNLTVVNGKIYANGEAMQSIAQLEEQAIQASVQSARQELINKQMELEASKAIVDAQIATLEWKIKVAEGSADAEEFKSKAEEAWLNASNQMNTFFIQNQAKVAQAMVQMYSQAFTQVAVKYNQLQTAMAKGEVTPELLGEIKDYWADIKKDLNFGAYSGEVEKIYNDSGLSGLRNQLEAAKNASAAYQTQISNINLKLATLDSGLWSSGKGVDNGSGKGSGDKLTQYIGKLKEIYNILNRIQVLEHRLSTLDAYSEIAGGERYGELLHERLKYNEELLDQYEFLTREQKQFTNGYKDFINSVEGLEGVFDFDKFGQIIINWDKYTELQDVAAKGEVTLKQKADDVYETYTQMFEDLHGYFDKTIEYYKAVINLQREMVDSYISLQDKVADAIKEIYKKILDTKLDAIDREKEALEELKEARDRANKDTKNAKEVSNLQTNLQRAMMDTSGASDIAFIKSQKDIQDKLDEIAEDKYSTMLQDIQDKLDEEKDALQREFDDMFEQLDWLFQWIDNDIMLNKDAMYDIFEQTDEWNQSSFLKRQDMLEDWEKKFHTYYEDVLHNDKGIYGIYQNITDTRARIDELDKNLQQSISKGSYEIAKTLGEWNASVQSSISGLASQISSLSNSRNTGGSTYNIPQGTVNTNNTGDVKTWSVVFFSDGKKVGEKTAKVGSPITISYSCSKTGYTLSGWTIDGKLYGTYTSSTPRSVRADALWTKKSTAGTFNRDTPKGVPTFDTGGLADFTGPAWLDGTKQNPEMVLNSLQTKHFISFVDTIDKAYAGIKSSTEASNSSITIGSIGFQVDSMSSPEDGEKAFNMFVDKFKEIGNQTGIKINSFKNTL